MEGNDTPEVVVEVREEPKVENSISERTRLEIEAGRVALEAHVTSTAAEKGE